MMKEFQEELKKNFNEEVDVILVDCEGTESSDNVGTSKLYLINMLINSVIHIHVSKAIDKNFADKFSQGLISSNEVMKSLRADYKEILPALMILIKDTTQKSWENAAKLDTNLKNYEDLLKKYQNLYDYYKEFPESQIQIIPPPKVNEDDSYFVTDKTSLYWKNLEKVFLQSISYKKLKNRNELFHFIKNVAKVINDNNLMNVKSELESFYSSIFLIEKNKLLSSIINRYLSNFDLITDFNPEQIKNSFLEHTSEEVPIFLSKIDNISCKQIFNDLRAIIDQDIIKINEKLEVLYKNKKEEYLFEREFTKKIENIYEQKKTFIPISKVNKFHPEIVQMCQNCGNSPSSQGCYKHSTEGSDLNVYLIVVTFGIYGKKKNPIISYSHPGPIGDFCKNCKKTRDSSGCNSEVETSFLESSETIYTGCKFEYTKEEWNSLKFKNDCSFLLKQYLKEK